MFPLRALQKLPTVPPTPTTGHCENQQIKACRGPYKCRILSGIRKPTRLCRLLLNIAALSRNAIRTTTLALRLRFAFRAEKLLLRKELVLYLKREVRHRRAGAPMKFTYGADRFLAGDHTPSATLVHSEA